MKALERTLEKLLGAHALPLDETPQQASAREDAVVETPATIAGWFKGPHSMPYAPLARRGLLVAFDGEGSYFEAGAHARLARYLLLRAGMTGVTATDRRTQPRGLWVAVEGPAGRFERADPHAHDSDYAFVEPVVAVCNDVLEAARAKFRLCRLQSDDQGVLIALAPQGVRRKLEAALGELLEDAG